MSQQHQRIRGRKGVKLRKAVRDREPLCRSCTAVGRVTVATEIDHIVPLSRGGTNDPSNLQPLCANCHLEKTVDRRKHGVDETGWPLDPEHPWAVSRRVKGLLGGGLENPNRKGRTPVGYLHAQRRKFSKGG